MVVWVRRHVGVVVVGINAFEAVEGVAKVGDVFALRLNEAVEAVMIPMVVETLEEFNGGTTNASDVVFGRSTHHRVEGVGGGGEGVGDIVRG